MDAKTDISFKPKTPKEIESEKTEVKSLERRLKAVVKTINNCFDSPEFSNYKKAYEAYREHAIQTLIDLPESEPIKFTIEAKSLLREIAILGFLGKQITDDKTKIKRRIK